MWGREVSLAAYSDPEVSGCGRELKTGGVEQLGCRLHPETLRSLCSSAAASEGDGSQPLLRIHRPNVQSGADRAAPDLPSSPAAAVSAEAVSTSDTEAVPVSSSRMCAEVLVLPARADPAVAVGDLLLPDGVYAQLAGAPSSSGAAVMAAAGVIQQQTAAVSALTLVAEPSAVAPRFRLGQLTPRERLVMATDTGSDEPVAGRSPLFPLLVCPAGQSLQPRSSVVFASIQDVSPTPSPSSSSSFVADATTTIELLPPSLPPASAPTAAPPPAGPSPLSPADEETLALWLASGSPGLLISGAKGAGKTHVLRHILARHSPSSTPVDAMALFASMPPTTPARHHILGLDNVGMACSLLPRAAVRQRLAQLFDDARTAGRRVVVVVERPTQLPRELELSGDLSYRIELAAPTSEQRQEQLSRLLGSLDPADLSELAQRTAGYQRADLTRLAARVCENALLRSITSGGAMAKMSAGPDSPSLPADYALDVRPALAATRPAVLDVVAAERLPAVSWSAVGGYTEVRQRLEAVLACVRAGRVGKVGLSPPSGALLHGPSGCGKTLLVQALATSCDMNVVAVRSAALLGRYLGETEQRIRAVFAAARKARPCLVVIDDVDALAARRAEDEGGQESAGGVEARALSQLLNEIDGINDAAGVFVLGCTNQPVAALDSAMLRPGRLELQLAVERPGAMDAEEILRVCLRETATADDVDVQALAELARTAASNKFSGADLAGLVQAAALTALRGGREAVGLADLQEAFRQRRQSHGLQQRFQ